MQLQSQGISMDDYMKIMGSNIEVLRASARPAALRQVQMELALTAVADAEDLQVSDEEVEAEVNRLAEQYKLPAEQVKAAVPQEDLRRELRLKKANRLVLDAAQVGEAPKKEEAEEKPKKTARKGTSRKKVEETAEAAVEKTEE